MQQLLLYKLCVYVHVDDNIDVCIKHTEKEREDNFFLCINLIEIQVRVFKSLVFMYRNYRGFKQI